MVGAEAGERVSEFCCRSGGWLLCWLKFAVSHFGTATRGFSSMKILSRIAFLGSLFLFPLLLHAQGACVDSPECPTAILGVVGAAGAALYVRWRSR